MPAIPNNKKIIAGVTVLDVVRYMSAIRGHARRYACLVSSEFPIGL